jgi:hypothetical protein
MRDVGTAQVPPLMRDAAQELGLGARKGLVANSPRSLPWGPLIGLSLVSAPLLTVAVTFAINDQREEGAWYYSLPLLILAMVPPAILVWLLVAWWRGRDQQRWIAWHEGGVVYHAEGFETHAYPWAQIHSLARHDIKVTNGVVSTTTRKLHVRAADGLSFTVSDAEYAGMEPFAEGMTDAFSRARVAEDAARLEGGACLSFGVLDMPLGGVGQGAKRIGWAEVERIDVKNGNVRIHRRGQHTSWLKVPAPGFPNLLVFLTLADALSRSASTG